MRILPALILALAVPAFAAEHPKEHPQEHPAPAAKAAPKTIEFTAVNLEYEGAKVWVPSVFIAKKGQKVKITLINNAPSGIHGFSIDEFGVKEAVNKGEKKTVEFKADKAGLFRSYCQLHPAHVGGQILVIE